MENLSKPDIFVDTNTNTDIHHKGFFTAVFGQFATREFWRDMVALLVKEAVSSFISVLGGTLIYSVQKRVTPESSNIRRIVDGSSHPVAVQPQANPSSVFSSAYQPQSSYKPTHTSNQSSPSYSPPSGSTPIYPGFG